MAAKRRLFWPGGTPAPMSKVIDQVRLPGSVPSGGPGAKTQYPVPSSAKRTATAVASSVTSPP